jgi:thiamine pyrophosphate-dependent acetolactate synthase large subunit-like protein
MVGNHADGAERAAGVQSLHSAQALGALVRDYTKWDDEPYSLGHFAESSIRAYKIAMTPPMGPVLIVASNDIQSHPAPAQNPRIPKLVLTTPPAGDMNAVAEAAKMLVAAERPQIIAQHMARTPAGIKSLVELAETLQSRQRGQVAIDQGRHARAIAGWRRGWLRVCAINKSSAGE